MLVSAAACGWKRRVDAPASVTPKKMQDTIQEQNGSEKDEEKTRVAHRSHPVVRA